MAIISIMVFSAALVASIWTMFVTIAPQSARIVDLLVNGPEYAPRPVSVATVRATRDVRAQRVSAPVRRRAAA